MTLTPQTAKELVEAAKEVIDVMSHGQTGYDAMAALNHLRAALSKAEKEMEGGG